MTPSTTMLILGGDRIAQRARMLPELAASSVLVVTDRSTSIKRVLRLVWRRRLDVGLVLKMLMCERRRPRLHSASPGEPEVRSNGDLVSLIAAHRPQRIVLFRAGLIINRAVIATGVPLLNIHCARVPEYGGLGSIARALRDNATDQCATLHQVTTTIDEGRVFDVEPYALDPRRSYCDNEAVAYDAGLRLLARTLASGIGTDVPCHA